ncbi:hypothetical protein LZ023_39365 (plasmid) [Pseudomonas silvicola]|nr:hypothetical protein LZ023_39365 [Pseudomonas silvicola]
MIVKYLTTSSSYFADSSDSIPFAFSLIGHARRHFLTGLLLSPLVARSGFSLAASAAKPAQVLPLSKTTPGGGGPWGDDV